MATVNHQMRDGTRLVFEIPPEAGKPLRMRQGGDDLYVACERAVYKVSADGKVEKLEAEFAG